MKMFQQLVRGRLAWLGVTTLFPPLAAAQPNDEAEVDALIQAIGPLISQFALGGVLGDPPDSVLSAFAKLQGEPTMCSASSRFAVVAITGLFVLSGCMTAPRHRADVQDNTINRMTVGTVQREIGLGMSASQVAEVLGSPNIVSTDEERRETWIYDKISTDIVYSTSTNTWIFGDARRSGAASQSQRTLTVIVKFDHDTKVRDFAYHTSRF